MTQPEDSIFGFPRKEREAGFQYNRHFIRAVNLSCHFAEVGEISRHRDIVRTLVPETWKQNLENVFSNLSLSIVSKDGKPTVQQDLTKAGVALVHPEQKAALALFTDAMRYDVAGAAYTNFETFMSEVDIVRVLQALGLSTVRDISFKKSNWFEFMPTEDGRSAYDHFLLLFGRELAEPLKKYPSQDRIQSHGYTTHYEKGDYSMIISIGIQNPRSSSRGRLFFDVQISHKNYVEVAELRQMLKRMNDEIFNVFHWAATNELITILNSSE